MTHCPSCDRYMPQREATVWNADGAYCGSCEDKTMRLFCKDLVHEVLFEDEGERSAFFPDLINAEAPVEQSELQHAAE